MPSPLSIALGLFSQWGVVADHQPPEQQQRYRNITLVDATGRALRRWTTNAQDQTMDLSTRTMLDIGPLPELSEYRLVWDVTCEGGAWLQRGNGTDLTTFLKDRLKSASLCRCAARASTAADMPW